MLAEQFVSIIEKHAIAPSLDYDTRNIVLHEDGGIDMKYTFSDKKPIIQSLPVTEADKIIVKELYNKFKIEIAVLPLPYCNIWTEDDTTFVAYSDDAKPLFDATVKCIETVYADTIIEQPIRIGNKMLFFKTNNSMVTLNHHTLDT